MTRAVTFLLMGLVLILGTCVLDGHDPAGQDLCFALLGLAHGAELGWPLGLTGTLVPVLAHDGPIVPLDRPVPPPRA